LIAGPVANRLLGPATGGVLAAGFTGAGLLLLADLVARHVLPTPLPTGVVTGAVGAPYLLWLLATANREGVGG
jgi:iron complex transport system permease protein